MQKLHIKLGFAMAAVLCVVLYLPSINGPFLYDDLQQVVTNTSLHQLINLDEVVFCGLRQIRMWQNLSFALNWAISSNATWSFKITNLLLHITNAALLFSLLLRLFPQRRFIATLTTALFLLHPLQAQAVTYVMGRVSLLQAAFVLLALNLSARRARPMVIGAVIVLSLLAKESCLLIPILIVAFELAWGEPIERRRVVTYFGATVAFVPIYLVLRDPVSMYRGTSGFDLFPYGEYLVTQLGYYARHLVLLISPAEQSFIHPYPAFSTTIVVWGIAGAITCAALLLLGILLWRRDGPEHRLVAFFVLFFFVTLAPTSSILQMKNPFAEYRLYQANISLFFLIALGLELFARRFERDWMAKVAAICLLFYFAFFTYHHNRLYADTITLYSYAAELYPASSELQMLVGSQREQRGELEEAEGHFLRAVELNRHEVIETARPQFRLARLYFLMGQYQRANEELQKLPVNDLRYGEPPETYRQLREQLRQALPSSD